MKLRPHCPVVFVWLMSVSCALVAEGAEPIDFGSQIRPLLSDRCFSCHGPDEGHRPAGLRLDAKAAALAELESGSVAIVPGDLAKSELWARISSHDEDLVMPPADSGKKLSPEEIDLLKRWIEAGAPWQEHWSFIAPQKAELPEVKNMTWPQGPIDRFVLERLEKEKLAPSPEADKVTLLRRVTLDLTGLPPTLGEIDAFLKDESPDAYEKVVDRLLRSPRYGENMARFWLDVARYGDTHGLHLDNYREMWPYRDWVIKAFNDNKPFDQFIIEQLAGDLLPNATPDQLVATGFNRCHVTTNEGGSIVEEVYVRNVNDRVVTTSTVMLGLTFDCTRCHDHKYDPITQKDFYSLFAYFNSLEGADMDGNNAQHPPIARVLTPEAQAALAVVQADRKKLNEQLEASRTAAADSAQFSEWVAKLTGEQGKEGSPLAPAGMIAHYALDEGTGKLVNSTIGGLPEGKVNGSAAWQAGKFGKALDFNGQTHVDLGDVGNFERDQGFSYGAWVNPRNNGGGVIFARMEDGNAYRGYDLYVSGGNVSVHIIHQWPGNAIKVTTKNSLKNGQWQHVFATYDGSGKSSGIKIYFDGQPQEWKIDVDNLRDTIQTSVSMRLGSRTPGSPFQGLVDDARIFARTLSHDEVKALAGQDPIGPILALEPAKRSPEQVQTLVSFYLSSQDETWKKLNEQLAELSKREAEASKQAGTTLIWKEMAKPKPAFILNRGEYDKRKDQVERAVPGVLPPLPEGAPNNRLGLAQWMVDPSHPLTSRVTVNRFWQQVFGTGIVKTSEDFGSQGEPPSHPALIDWLAVNFRESGWNVKGLMKEMVMSATYRQSSAVTPALLERDPENRLFARGPRFRLDGETVRDNALFAAGMLSEKIGGPSVKPYQPQGIWEPISFTSSNTLNYKRDVGESLYRRTMYTFWKRTAPPPSMLTFDAPSRENCTARRARTNTPLQALVLLNDEQFVEAARFLAERAITEGGATPEERLAWAFRAVTSREPDASEKAELVSLYQDELARYLERKEEALKLLAVGERKRNEKLDPSELAAYTIVANTLLNLDEVITKE